MEELIDCPMIVRAVDLEGFIRVNGAFCEKVGFSEKELAQTPLLDWIDPKITRQFMPRLNRARVVAKSTIECDPASSYR